MPRRPPNAETSTDDLDLHPVDFGRLRLKAEDIPPRRFVERVRLAIRWSREYHDRDDDPDEELGVDFMRQLGHVGLKLVWLDGSEVTPAQLQDRRRRKR